VGQQVKLPTVNKYEKGPRLPGSQPTEVTWTPAMDLMLTQMRQDGVSMKNCARRLKLGEGTVGRRARLLGLPNVNPVLTQSKAEPAPVEKPPRPQPLRHGASTLPPLASELLPPCVIKGQ
jgi:hypothetical protein